MLKSLEELVNIIRERKNANPEKSYTNKLLNDKKHLDSILFDGSQKADRIASKKIKEIKQLIGF